MRTQQASASLAPPAHRRHFQGFQRARAPRREVSSRCANAWLDVLPDALVIINQTGNLAVVIRQLETWLCYPRQERKGFARSLLFPSLIDQPCCSHAALRLALLSAVQLTPPVTRSQMAAQGVRSRSLDPSQDWCFPCLGQRQGEPEGRPLAECAVQANLSLLPFDQHFGDIQSQT